MKERDLQIVAITLLLSGNLSAQTSQKAPNIVYIMSDDHSYQTIGVYANCLKEYVKTPNIDRIAKEGMRLDNCCVTNSVSTPSRAAILTGAYSHHNGVYTLGDSLPARAPNLAKELQKQGYQTAVIGKWHLGSQPEGFDYYSVLVGQGDYVNPGFLEKNGKPFRNKNQVKYPGYCTDLIGDKCIQWLDRTKKGKPFFLMCHFKAPHTPFTAASRHEKLYDDAVFPEPSTLYDTHEGRPSLARTVSKIENNREVDKSLPPMEKRKISYQNFIRKYLRCIAAVDENVGRLLQYLEEKGELDNTLIVYTSDQGFYMGEHGLWDKRFMYEESLRMPFMIRYPKEIKAGSVNHDLILNIDFAPTFLAYAGVQKPPYMDGRSFRDNLKGKTDSSWRKSMYYRYWQNFKGYNIPAHYGMKTEQYKLIYYYGKSCGMSLSIDKPFQPVWELYDLKKDPLEMKNEYNNPEYKKIVFQLKKELASLQKECGDQPVQ